MKICSKCKRELPKDTNHFNKHKGNKDGLQYYCKECRGYSFTDYVLEEPKKGHYFCITCKREFPLTSKYWNKGNNKHGLRSECRDCTKAYDEQWRKENPHAWDEWYEENREYKKAKCREWIEDNKEYKKEYDKEYMELNGDRVRAQRRKYRRENPHVARAWYEQNKKSRAEYNREWSRSNKEKLNNYYQKRRARKESLPNTLTVEQWNSIIEDFNHQCAYCGEDTELTREHFIALSRGGEYTHNNIIPACKSCNSSKMDKDFFQWYPTKDYYSKERKEFILEYLGYNKNIQQLSIL